MDVALAALMGLVAGAVVAGWALARRVAPPPSAARSSSPLAPRLLETTFDALTAGVVIVGEDDDVILANEASVVLGATNRERLATAPLLQVVREARATGRTVETELQLAGETGEVPLNVQATPVSAEGDVLLLLTDTTEARRIDAIRRDFVANVSHELKTPVGALSLLAEAVMEAAGEPDDVRRFAGRMQHESERLARLVQELIDLSRLQGAEPGPQGTNVGVPALLQDAADRVRLAAESKRIDVAIGDTVGLAVRGDAEQLTTALGNLLDNAIAYSAPETRVGVGARLAGDFVEISVTDEGIGIPPEDVERIFERFYRVDPARSRATGGTGLGLALVKHIVTNHGGHVTVWSAEGSGSTFTLHLPAVVTGEGVGAA